MPYESKSESLAEGYLAKRAEKYAAPVPDGALFLTMAVDVQKNRLEYEIVGWGEGEESWGIEYGVIRGIPSELHSGNLEEPSVWEVLDRRFAKKFIHEDGGEIGIGCMVIDSGGNDTDAVYQYVSGKQRKREMVLAIKGSSIMDKPLLNPPTPARGNRPLLLSLGVEQGKTLVHGRLKKEKPGPGYCHFPRDENTGYDARYYAGLTGEKRVRRVMKGGVRLKWEKIKGRHNEPFDLRVYGTAAVRFLVKDWQERREMRQTAIGKRDAAIRTPSRRPHKKNRRSGGVKLISI